MGLKLKTVVPWGRSLDEYIRMFALTPGDLQLTLLDCAGGPASFNAELTGSGGRVVSCDPIYQFALNEIQQRIQDTYPLIIAGVSANLNRYRWHSIQSPEQLGEVRLKAMQQFLADFPNGLATGRYQVAELPTLPFGDRQFDLALCSHLLFTYSDQLSVEFHLASIQELCRVAAEVRIFPLLTLAGEDSPLVPIVVDTLKQQGYEASIHTVDYEFQRGGNQLLRIKP
ncbi:SAM-dependent methyltransferase [Oculatella sp. LEGE 06141]|uniref:class I SAM-dependent methyltransferase n=1 Tax=Oculatella sp. LEGE 06141 TaxID=1828648 RepID=UPI001882E217|nr:class I SAM-dependent methyltransferase [Oculatella sp. LEGE 06141]MBE9178320.1 SAM-dependent methyltransferase [Oculatella sp. LEGE 06141]